MSLEETYLQDLENDFESSDDEKEQEDGEQLTSVVSINSEDGSSAVHLKDSLVKGDGHINTTENSSGYRKTEVDDFGNDNINDDVLMAGIKKIVANERNLTTEDLISQLDMKSVKSIKQVSNLLDILGPVLQRIRSLEESGSVGAVTGAPLVDNSEYKFLVTANEFSAEINNEIMLVHNFLKVNYSPRFPELESIVPDPVDFARTVLIIKNDLQDVSQKSNELKKVLSGEKLLVINMSILELATKPLPEETMTHITEACEVLLNLHEARTKIMLFVSSRLSRFAPNLTKIVGSQCAVQLMSYSGGLEGLLLTPSCNVPSIGNKRPVKIGFGQTGIRQQGFLFHSPIISEVPDDIKKQAMRIVSGKLILAARIDFSGSNSDGSFADKVIADIHKKFEKLLEPPQVVGPKALPIPVDKTSKKRGGRRFRKFKEKFEMTELQKAQNRMAFGKEEDTVMDSYGEQIGLGLAGRNSLVSTGRIRTIKANSTNQKTQVSKKMADRLKNLDSSHNEILLTGGDVLSAPPVQLSISENNQKWIGQRDLKRKASDSDVGPNSKRHQA